MDLRNEDGSLHHFSRKMATKRGRFYFPSFFDFPFDVTISSSWSKNRTVPFLLPQVQPRVQGQHGWLSACQDSLDLGFLHLYTLFFLGGEVPIRAIFWKIRAGSLEWNLRLF